MWPKIRERVPDAELHVFYGFENWRKSATYDSGQLRLIEEVESKLKELEPLGVVLRGRVPQQDLAQEFLQAGAWLHPTWFTETSCITAMEAQASGLACVTSPIAALVETLGDRGTMISGDWLSANYQRAFIEAAVVALTQTTPEKRIAVSDYAKKHFDYATLIPEWERMFDELLGEIPTISGFKEHM
jgi:glycosyltransferase involved in cell wall biosynthesis